LIEVEVKAKIIDLNEVKEKLKKIKAEKIREEYQEDIYFDRKDIKFAENDKALRIRKILINGNVNSVVTYKGPKIDDLSKTREEIELDIGDSTKLRKIFENLGFYKGACVFKKREIYEIDDYIISLDNVENLGDYMEIELDLEDGSDFQPALKEIFDIFNKLGVNDGFERNSYLELIELNK
jgi:adenylate cyclase class 2